MIKEVYLFTNRNLIAFDEKGEQVIDIEKAICSLLGHGKWYWENYKNKEAKQKND